MQGETRKSRLLKDQDSPGGSAEMDWHQRACSGYRVSRLFSQKSYRYSAKNKPEADRPVCFGFICLAGLMAVCMDMRVRIHNFGENSHASSHDVCPCPFESRCRVRICFLIKALKGHNISSGDAYVTPFQGINSKTRLSQGVALGWYVTPLWG